MRVLRAGPPENGVRLNGALRLILLWACACFLVSTVGPPSHWRLMITSSLQSLCPPCDCHCSSSEYVFLPVDCEKDDPAMKEETKKDLATLLDEELHLQKIVANETSKHTKKLTMDAREAFPHYQKEAEKCNVAVKACEEARERVEAELRKERKLSALWKKRARQYGWNGTTVLSFDVTQLQQVLLIISTPSPSPTPSY